MENIKKYEIYINKRKTGILNINWKVTKKTLALYMAGIITATTLTGYSFYNKQNIVTKVTQEIEFDSLDDEIQAKLIFVDAILEEFTNNQPPFYLQIMEPYKKYKHLEYDLNSENEYASFYTEEEILYKKNMMSAHLDESIEVIERNSKYKFRKDSFVSNKIK